MNTTSQDTLEKCFKYLDELREKGTTNMMAGAAHLENEFGLSKEEARKILMKWMKNFKG